MIILHKNKEKDLKMCRNGINLVLSDLKMILDKEMDFELFKCTNEYSLLFPTYSGDVMPTLKILDPRYNGATYALNTARVTCGRDDKCDIVVVDSTISSVHCAFVMSDKDYMIQDCESTNGIFVNDEKVSSRLLKFGDMVRVGGIQFVYEEQGDLPVSKDYDDAPTTMTTRIELPSSKPRNVNITIFILMALVLLVIVSTIYMCFIYYFNS